METSTDGHGIAPVQGGEEGEDSAFTPPTRRSVGTGARGGKGLGRGFFPLLEGMGFPAGILEGRARDNRVD